MSIGIKEFELGGGLWILTDGRHIAFDRIGPDGCSRQRSQWFPNADAAFEAYANNQLDYKYEEGE